MFVMINQITIQNLPDGNLEVRSISREEAAELMALHRERRHLVGAFDLGAVPDKRKEAKFREALEVIRKIGLPLEEADFITGVEGEEGQQLCAVVPPELCCLQEDRPILVICYDYQFGPGHGFFFTPIHERASFRLFELLPADRSGAVARPASVETAISRSQGEAG